MSYRPTTVVNVKVNSTADVVMVDRTTIFGNPFHRGKDGDRDEVVRKYRGYFHRRVTVDAAFREAVLRLKGKTLGCHCAPKKCHGSVIAEWLELRD